MTEVVIVLLLLAAAAWAQWLVADLRTLPAPGTRPAPAPGAGHRRVSVVVPARDEEQTLPDLLASLATLTVPVAEVVVVDDASADRTADVAAGAGARVVPAGTPPPGWTGKAWACHRGAEEASGDLLLFLDADTVLAPHALESLLVEHRRRGGLVSVQPFHAVRRPYEQLSAYFNLVAVMASSAFTRHPRRAMAFGPCLLTARDDLAHAGGHAAVRGEVLDDASLAAAYHRAGLPVWCAVGGDALRMRSYPGGLGQLVAGWTKNIASGASAASPSATLGTVLWISAHHAVAVGAVSSLLELVTGLGDGLSTGHPLLWAVAWLGTSWQVRHVLRQVGAFRWWTWALFPLPLLAFDLVFARSAALTVVRRSVPWRGREVDLRGRGSAREVV
ncbi:glycosyltransferase [Nocardioides renjunii]|uniref:glycosyltransferase n=1 Tax=Nocardioides renjunii TaxID=3095075 RepID=UPI002AFDE784|nr:glycosyltransferase [Nocardioides sp. S-34]WQQ20778.1 glycosyltransferase [Nocardioides sp. S-34]